MSHEPENPLHGGTHKGHKPGDDERHDRHGEDEHHDHGPWKLNVQGVIIESPQPEIVVRQAIKQAGFNPDTPWIIILKVAGEPKREVDLSFVIDLRHKGIETKAGHDREAHRWRGNTTVPRRKKSLAQRP